MARWGELFLLSAILPSALTGLFLFARTGVLPAKLIAKATVITKTCTVFVALSLFWLASPTKLWADEAGDIQNFNRSLGLDGMGPDLAKVEQELAHSGESNSEEQTPHTAGHGKKPGVRPKSSGGQPHPSFSNLSYHSNPQVSNVVRNYVMSQFAQNNTLGIPPYDVLIRRFDQRFAEYGFSSHNVGDTVAGYFIVSWEVLHNADASRTPGGIRRVRDAVCQILEQRGKAAHEPDETKQKVSELLKSVGEILSEKAKLVRQANNPATEQKFMDSVAAVPLRLGLDLRRMQLTNQGFVNG